MIFTPFLIRFPLCTLSPQPFLASVSFIFPTVSISFFPTIHLFMNGFYYTFPLRELYCMKSGTLDCFAWYGISDPWLGTQWMLKTYFFAIKYKNKYWEALSDTILPYRGKERAFETEYSQTLCFPLVPLADRWCSADWWPAPDTTFWKHRKQVPA